MIIDDNFSYFSFKPYVLTPNLIRLNEGSQLIFFDAGLRKNIPNYHQILPLIRSSVSLLNLLYLLIETSILECQNNPEVGHRFDTPILLSFVWDSKQRSSSSHDICVGGTITQSLLIHSL